MEAGDMKFLYVAVALALVIPTVHWWEKGSSNLSAKRKVLQRLCASTYQLTEGYRGDTSAVSSALNETALVFADDGEVQEKLRRLKRDDHASRDVPDLIRAMAAVVKMKVNTEAFERPFIRRPFRGGNGGRRP